MDFWINVLTVSELVLYVSPCFPVLQSKNTNSFLNKRKKPGGLKTWLFRDTWKDIEI